jgi:hypothetical protein
MAIAALVVHADLASAVALTRTLADDPTAAVGEAQVLPAGVLLPVAIASLDAEEGEARYEELRAHPGVLAVDVVMIDFSDEAL